MDQIDALAATSSILALDQIVGNTHTNGTAASLSRRSGLDMTQLLASGENDDIGAVLRGRGWSIRETPVADLAASYARDLTDPLGGTEDAGAPESPWLETRFLQGSR